MYRRVTSVGVVLLAVVSTTPVAGARAQQPSFDCFEASSPIELLVCSDPQLMAMDGDLGEALATRRRRLLPDAREAAAAEQRKWLADRLVRCGVPAEGDEVPQELRWAAAPCLDEMYRARLEVLGVTPPPVVSPSVRAGEPGYLHPACLWIAVDQDMEEGEELAASGASGEPIPLGACTRGNRHIPVEETPEGLSSPGAADGNRTSITYRSIGTAPDGREVILVWYGTGGSGRYSEIFALRRTPSADGRDVDLAAEPVGAGGDRCNGGIEGARITPAGKLEVDYQVTPLDLLSEADETLAEENMRTLALCAACCIGTVRRDVDLGTREETTVSATVDRLLSREPDGGGGGSAQDCFDDILARAAGTLPHTFGASDLKGVADTFARTCRSRAARGPG